MSFVRFGLVSLAAGFALALPAPSTAFPTRTVHIVVPFGAGGMPDLLARAFAEKAAAMTGQPFVVENRPGASGNLGGEVVARAEPDGHQLLLTPGNLLTVNRAIYPKMPFDPAAALVPVSLVAEMPTVLVTHTGSNVASLRQFFDAAKARPGQLFYASPGPGSSLHLAMEMLKDEAGLSLQHVGYKSGAEALAAVMSGQVLAMFANVPLVLSHVKAGRVNAIAVGAARRLPQLPDVPTIAEAELKGFVASSWFGLAAPARTPAAIVEQVSALADRALRDPDLQRRFFSLGAQLATSSPTEFAAFVAAERERHEALVRRLGITAN